VSGWGDRAIGAAQGAQAAAEIAWTIAGSAMAPAANMPASYMTDKPAEQAVVADMVEADKDADKIADDMDLEGEQEAEYADTSPPADDSTFAAAKAEAAPEAAVDGEGDAFAAADGIDAGEAAQAEEGEGDAFAAEDAGALDGDMGDVGDVDGDAGDGDAGADGDAGGDGDGGSGGW
jgi:hypothetical protein